MIVKKSVCGRRQRSTDNRPGPFEHSHHAQSIVGRNSRTKKQQRRTGSTRRSCYRPSAYAGYVLLQAPGFERITFNFWLSVRESIAGNDKLIQDRLEKSERSKKEQSLPWLM